MNIQNKMCDKCGFNWNKKKEDEEVCYKCIIRGYNKIKNLINELVTEFVKEYNVPLLFDEEIDPVIEKAKHTIEKTSSPVKKIKLVFEKVKPTVENFPITHSNLEFGQSFSNNSFSFSTKDIFPINDNTHIKESESLYEDEDESTSGSDNTEEEALCPNYHPCSSEEMQSKFCNSCIQEKMCPFFDCAQLYKHCKCDRSLNCGCHEEKKQSHPNFVCKKKHPLKYGENRTVFCETCFNVCKNVRCCDPTSSEFCSSSCEKYSDSPYCYNLHELSYNDTSNGTCSECRGNYCNILTCGAELVDGNCPNCVLIHPIQIDTVQNNTKIEPYLETSSTTELPKKCKRGHDLEQVEIDSQFCSECSVDDLHCGKSFCCTELVNGECPFLKIHDVRCIRNHEVENGVCEVCCDIFGFCSKFDCQGVMVEGLCSISSCNGFEEVPAAFGENNQNFFNIGSSNNNNNNNNDDNNNDFLNLFDTAVNKKTSHIFN